jgi:hypothetical protein
MLSEYRAFALHEISHEVTQTSDEYLLTTLLDELEWHKSGGIRLYGTTNGTSAHVTDSTVENSCMFSHYAEVGANLVLIT